MDSGAAECSDPTPFAFEMVRVDASRRATSSAETEAALSLADAFFVGAMRFRLAFALVAMLKCLEKFKTNKKEKVCSETRVKRKARDRILTKTELNRDIVQQSAIV